MNVILYTAKFQFALVHMDDIVVFSRTPKKIYWPGPARTKTPLQRRNYTQIEEVQVLH